MEWCGTIEHEPCPCHTGTSKGAQHAQTTCLPLCRIGYAGSQARGCAHLKVPRNLSPAASVLLMQQQQFLVLVRCPLFLLNVWIYLQWSMKEDQALPQPQETRPVLDVVHVRGGRWEVGASS